MIEFEGKIGKALRARTRQHHGRGWTTAGLLLLVAGIGGFLVQPAPLEPARHFLPIFAALLGGAIVTMAVARRDEPDLAVSGSVSEQRLTIRVGEDEEHVQWSDFSRAILGPDFVLLQRSHFFQFVLAREFFRDAASWEELVSIVRRNVTVAPPHTLQRAVVMMLVWIAILAVIVFAYGYFTRSG
jgi:hypothetical protein